MEKLSFNTSIAASREKVWNVLWTIDTYRQWVAAFAEGSTAITDWQQGSKALFVDESGDGMVSEIAEARPSEYLSIRHLGMLQNGKEDVGPHMEWYGAMENYTLRSVDDDHTELLIDTDCADAMVDYMNGAWPQALAKLKALCEAAG